MNTFSSQIFRKKISTEIVFSLNNKLTLTNPREDSTGQLYVCNECGELLTFNEDGNYSTFLNLGGMPKCIAFTPTNNSIYIADLMNKVVYEKSLEKDKEINFIFKDYCGVSLKGPTSLVRSKDNDYIITADAGHFGSSTINNPCGSLYLFDINNNVLRPLILNTLSYPCDIYHDKDEDIFYVCEMLNNRILRLVQNPKGVFHSSVFYTFNGKLGPSAITMDEIGNIYVSRSDFYNKNDKKNNGIISIITKEGNLAGEIIVEGYSEINGLLIPRNAGKDEPQRNNENGHGHGNGNDTLAGSVIYFTDKNFSGVLKIKLSAISHDLEKLQENKY
jgi:DNA-binding beta-propeller fold protein YncE